MPLQSDTTRIDFDKLALLSKEGWDNNAHYHEFLLKQIPPRCDRVLEIGCGTGVFSRRLAERSNHVLAIDLSPNMIEIARKRSSAYSNIEYIIADVNSFEFPAEIFDCIASIATMHHLPFENMLEKMKKALKINGVLVILDINKTRSLVDFMSAALAVPASRIFSFINTGHFNESREVLDAWAEHGKYDEYLSIKNVREVCASALPGCEVRRHLLWRYSVVYRRGV